MSGPDRTRRDLAWAPIDRSKGRMGGTCLRQGIDERDRRANFWADHCCLGRRMELDLPGQFDNLKWIDAEAGKPGEVSQRSEFPNRSIRNARQQDFGPFGAEWHVHSVSWFVGGTNLETMRRRKT